MLADKAAWIVDADRFGSTVMVRTPGRADQTVAGVMNSDPSAEDRDAGGMWVGARRRFVTPAANLSAAPVENRTLLITADAVEYRVVTVSVGEFFTTLTLERADRRNFGDGRA